MECLDRSLVFGVLASLSWVSRSLDWLALLSPAFEWVEKRWQNPGSGLRWAYLQFRAAQEVVRRKLVYSRDAVVLLVEGWAVVDGICRSKPQGEHPGPGSRAGRTPAASLHWKFKRETSFYHQIHRSVHSCAVSRLGRHGYQEIWNKCVLASLVVGLRGREALHLSCTAVQTCLRFVLK